jgi:L-histidine Nalpha-methyltransferase
MREHAQLHDILDLAPRPDELCRVVLDGLAKPQKELPCELLYDTRGSALFEEICGLAEYYPTRTELAILERHRDEIAERLGGGVTVVDLGSGSSQKIDLLLTRLRAPAAYVPVDISRDYLREASAGIARRYPGLCVAPICADYTDRLELPSAVRTERVVVFFPGSTIGNLAPPAAEHFLRRMGRLAGPGGMLLIGVDTEKDPRVLEAAYDDARGVTAAFNLNLLARLNRELGADFDLEAFAHRAVYDRRRRRVEMHLRSAGAQTVRVAGHDVAFAAGETIHTESSHKYAPEAFAKLAERAGWRSRRMWLDDRGLFSVHLYAWPEAS